jgi:alpha-beta hydrolase superfamily lysophospholipase
LNALRNESSEFEKWKEPSNWLVYEFVEWYDWPCVCIVAGGYDAAEDSSGARMNFDHKRMRAQMRPLCKGDSNPVCTADYLEFYGFKNRNQDAHVTCRIGTLESDGKKLAAYVFEPAEYKGTVIILHGYLNHSGLMMRTAEHLLERGYAAAMFDLPGHGLSDGRRAAIDDFSEYGYALRDFLAMMKADVHGPYHIVGHSTGASAVMEYLLKNGDDSFDKVVLVAPLVRCGFWRPVQVVRWLFGPCGAVPRIFVKNSSDMQYLSFVKFKDPLQARVVPIEWLHAMSRWASRAAQYPAVLREVRIIQGDKDITVDWRYNIEFIRGKFAQIDITMIKGGDHELLNESDEIRSKVYECINEYLEG